MLIIDSIEKLYLANNKAGEIINKTGKINIIYFIIQK